MSETTKDAGDGGASEVPGNSVLRFLEDKVGKAPHVNLRDEDSATVSAPVIDPSSQEKLSVPSGRGNYQLMGEIARGGMGVVLKGHDTDLGRDIAVKVLDKKLCERMDVVQRFVEEAQIGGQLQHPGIVPVYELGLMEDERPYFTMKLVKGRTLAALLAQRETAADNRGRLIDIFESVCQTMAYAHSRGVIHRDLKPANIMVGAFGEVQVVDWGLAKVLVRGGTADEQRSRETEQERTILETVRSEGSSGSSPSLVGSVLGTPAYMPPEQAGGQVHRLDERSDVFALGAILCEILTGKPPYLGSPQELIEAASQADLESALARLDACDADPVLIRATRQCLMAAPVARPADAGVLAERIHDYVVSNEERAHQAEVEATEARVRAEQDRKARRLTLALGAAVVAIVLVGSGGWLWVQNERASQQSIETARLAEEAQRDLELRGEVNTALNEAAVLEGAERWEEAIVVAERARGLAEGGGADAALVASVDATLATLNEGLAGAERREAFRRDTQRLVAELRQVSRPNDQLEDADRDRQFRATFLAHDIDLDAGTLEEAAALLTDRGLGAETALALDAWGEVRRLREDEGGALRLLELAHLIDPDPDRAHLREAMAVRDLEELRYLAGEGFEGQPASTWALLGASLVRLEDRELGLQIYRRAIELHPDDFELHYLLASELTPEPEVQRSVVELHEAASRWRAALAVDPDCAPARLALGDVYRHLLQMEAALAQYDRGLESDPELLECAYRKGQVLLAVGRFEEAGVAFERALAATQPDWLAGWARAGLAESLAVRGEHERALELSLESWHSEVSAPIFARVFLLEAMIVVAAKTEDRALVEEMRRLVETHFLGNLPLNYSQAHSRWAGSLVFTGLGGDHPFGYPYEVSDAGRRMLLEAAVEILDDTIAYQYAPQLAELHMLHGMANLFLGNAEVAVESLRTSLDLGGEQDAEARFGLALALHTAGDEAAGLELYARTSAWLVAHPEDLDPNVAWVRRECGRRLGIE